MNLESLIFKGTVMAFKVLLANTRGMCAGVERAISVVNKALDKYGSEKIYVLHEVVHNRHVVEELAKKGAHFVESLDKIPNPQDKVVIFSAHGVGVSTVEYAQDLGLQIIDATCPLVKRIHYKVAKASAEGKEVIIIGHDGHQEVLGTVGQYTKDPALVHVILTPEDVQNCKVKSDNVMFATQTTLSVDETALTVQALKAKFPQIDGPKTDDTCFATQNRQAAVKELAHNCDLVIVAGSANSSNSRRLSEVAIKEGTKSVLVDDYQAIDPEWLKEVKVVGVTAGASVPEDIVKGILDYLEQIGATSIEAIGPVQSRRTFPLPDVI